LWFEPARRPEFKHIWDSVNSLCSTLTLVPDSTKIQNKITERVNVVKEIYEAEKRFKENQNKTLREQEITQILNGATEVDNKDIDDANKHLSVIKQLENYV